MDLKHRKLITDTVTINVTALCEPFCDPTAKSTDSYCPDLCFYSCPQTCFINYPPLVPPPDDDPINNHHPNSSQKVLHLSLAISLSILGIACFIYCLCTIYKHCKNRDRGRSPIQGRDRTHDWDDFFNEHRGPILDHPIWYIRTPGLQPSVINLITSCKYRRGEGLIDGTECSVCLSEFEEDETLRLLPKCNHAFHLPCVDTWLRSHTNCPLCRAPIVANPNGTLSPALQQSTERNSALADGEEEEEEETPVVIQEGSGGHLDLESRIGIVLKGIGTSEQGGMGNEEKSMSRSVSMDSSSASVLITATANAPSSSRLGKSDRINSANGVAPKEKKDPNPILQRSSIARSFSCSGKAPISMHNRTRESVLPS